MAVPEGFLRPGEEAPQGKDILAVEVGHIEGYRIIYLQTAANWSAYSLDLPGIYAGGVTRAEAEKRFRAALPGHLTPTRYQKAASV